ncbi:DUF1232 domain-containing protein [Bacillus sp. Au-Bac7]|uniref:DUF1232 domain-containing protein n=1 Tax=Bacillus sp. Au-Bac7 TaxID=2906458 RepID=UPI001E624F50|nr:DUF1232 domain-containing protein [Bacillus sp. Au-Bac7]MCE4050793.1 DUF1232 domain-containing protein [Bacillus sp. Au-Bac7]
MTSNEINENKLGHLLKTTLENQKISMSKLSLETNIDKATISRIISGKRKATPKHLQAISESLHIPVYELFTAAGYTEKSTEADNHFELHAKIDAIQNMINSSGMYSDTFKIEEVEKQINVYSNNVHSSEEQKNLITQFKKKVKKLGSEGPFIQQLEELYYKFRYKKGSPAQLLLMASGLFYFVSTLDVIPDYILPIGYLDDVIAINIILDRISKL